jgi:GH25 family lysozyme M1 (1,4-beta-N-acetylmuramidase)
MTVKMPDVSEFQSGPTAPDWGGIESQNGGAAIIRVGYGITHLDNMFVANYTALKARRYDFIGLYHYIRADQDARAQAVAFCNWVGPLSALFPGSIPMMDLEEGSGNQSGRALDWLSFVDHFYGLDKLPLDKRSWLYSGQSFSVSHGLSPIFNSARHTWIAAYQSSEAGLQPHTLWQSTNGSTGTNKTSWSGCGFVDTSITDHTLAELSAMAYQLPAPPDPPAPSEGDEMIIFEVSRQLCEDQHVQWPGVFLLSGSTLHHVTQSQTDSKGVTVSNTAAYLAALGQTTAVDITPDEFKALGGTLKAA